MKVSFTKMHGLGNDFVVFDATIEHLSLTADQIRLIADRHFGVGCDQVLFIEMSDTPGVDFFYRIFNADGGEVEQCGNGARCFARYVRDKGLTDKDKIIGETRAGLVTLEIEENGAVTVEMGKPCFIPEQIPFQAKEAANQYPIMVGSDVYQIGVVSLGNPHAVLTVDNVDTAAVTTIGPQLTSHIRFPKRVNVGFMQVVDKSKIRLRVYERGVGETLACGTGACAAVIIGNRLGKLDNDVTVNLPGGQLRIRWSGKPEDPVFVTGPISYVFEGTMEL